MRASEEIDLARRLAEHYRAAAEGAYEDGDVQVGRLFMSRFVFFSTRANTLAAASAAAIRATREQQRAQAAMPSEELRVLHQVLRIAQRIHDRLFGGAP